LQSDVVRVLAERLAGYRIVVPVDGTVLHPLSAVYTTDLLPEIRGLLSAGRLRPAFLFDTVRTYYVPVEELRAVDPDLGTLHNLNHPADYRAALQCCGFDPPRELEKLT
jgi:molybdopterin-guanine dinucleotide biosynthesis protein A